MADSQWGTGLSGTPLASAKSGLVSAAARLHRSKYRSERGSYLAEGPQAVRALLAASPSSIDHIFITPSAVTGFPDIVAHAHSRHVTVHACDDAAMARLANATTPAGVVAVAQIVEHSVDEVCDGARLAVLLYQVNDPGNVGTIIRTADAVAASAVILTPLSVDPYNDKCVRSTAGSIAHVPVVSGAPTEDVFSAARAHGLQIVAAAMHGTSLASADVAPILAQPTLWVFGSEAHGLPDAVLAKVDHVVGIPMFGRAESLNLAVAAGVCLYATAMAHKDAHS